MSDIIVEVQQGKIKGTTGNDYYGGDFYKFMGIPYAKAPVGELRFKVSVILFIFCRFVLCFNF